MSNAWKEVTTRQAGSKGKVNNLKLEDGKTVEIRPVSEPKKFLKYFVNGKSAICEDRENCIIHKKHGKDPDVKFAIQVLDRADKTLKILECSPSVLKPIAQWAERRKRNPADPEQGIDWSITRTGQKKDTRYEVVPLDPTPLTPEEVDYIAKNKYDLDKMFKPTPDNEMEAKLGFEGATAPAPRANAPAATGTPVAVGAATGDGIDLPF